MSDSCILVQFIIFFRLIFDFTFYYKLYKLRYTLVCISFIKAFVMIGNENVILLYLNDYAKNEKNEHERIYINAANFSAIIRCQPFRNFPLWISIAWAWCLSILIFSFACLVGSVKVVAVVIGVAQFKKKLIIIFFRKSTNLHAIEFLNSFFFQTKTFCVKANYLYFLKSL